MFRLRNRLLLAFLVATLVPLSVSLWVTSSLIERSLSLSSTREIEALSRALKDTGHEYYKQARETLRADVESGRVKPERFSLAQATTWPEEIGAFWEGEEKEEMQLAGDGGNVLQYMMRRDDGVWRFTHSM